MPTFLFMPESAYGPTNNCIGIADVLARRGHKVVFAAERSWQGKLEPLGFTEDLVDLSPALAVDPAKLPGSAAGDPGAFWKEFITATAPEFRKPTIEQLSTFMVPTWQALVDGARFCEPQLREIVARSGADVLVEDNVVSFPALQTAGVPFVRIMSCNPLEAPGATIPPAYSGLAAEPSHRARWEEFRAEYDRTHRQLWEEFSSWCVKQGTAALPELEFIHTSPTANLYVYPTELDYTPARPLDATWHRLDSCVRTTDAPFELPKVLCTDTPLQTDGSGSGLIYLSLGSLGSADVELMRRLIAVLATTRHRFIVSLGRQHDELVLPERFWGAEFLPQTSVLPLVDLVITHGGNNTTTEAVHLGKPMIVLPLFWDQYDNAQRVHETGYGIRLDTYRFADAELVACVDLLLSDASVRQRAAMTGVAVRARDGISRAADLLERVVATT